MWAKLYIFPGPKIIYWHKSLHFFPAMRHSQSAGGFMDGDGKTWRHPQVLTLGISYLGNGFQCLGDCLCGGSDRKLIKQCTSTELGGFSSSSYNFSFSNIISLILDYEVLCKLEMFERKSSEYQMTPSLLHQWSAFKLPWGYHRAFICKLLFETHIKLDWYNYLTWTHWHMMEPQTKSKTKIFSLGY